MNRAAALRQYEQIHAKRPFHDGTFRHWSDTQSPNFPFHFLDGVTVWVSPEDASPHDQFLTEEGSSPHVASGSSLTSPTD